MHVPRPLCYRQHTATGDVHTIYEWCCWRYRSLSICCVCYLWRKWIIWEQRWCGSDILKVNLFIMCTPYILVSLRYDKIEGYIPWRIYTFTTMSVWFRPIFRSVSDQVVKEIKTQFSFAYFFIENRAVYGIKWKNILQSEGPQMTR
jgi:hypothetical protein